MLIEHRSYTLRPGAADLFWDAQRERGDDGLQGTRFLALSERSEDGSLGQPT